MRTPIAISPALPPTTPPPESDRTIRGFLSFPTDPPPEDILAGNGLVRVADPIFFNSGAGSGKSVAFAQGAISWGLGLPWLGIVPSRPLRVLHFVGEDDESTMGQCREGFLEHSEATTGRRVVRADLKRLDEMVRTDFSRQFTGDEFLNRMDAMMTEEPADVVMVNPLLSFIGGPIVECAGDFLRNGVMPIIQRHRAAALIAHHTCKLTKASWEEMDFTYSGIGGGEVANVPRSILTLAPTKVKGLHVLHVSKRQTTGWKDAAGNFVDHVFIRRSDDPTRPAWIPVSHEEAAAMIGAATPGKGEGRKATPSHVVAAVSTGAMTRQSLLEKLRRECRCSENPAKEALREARDLGVVVTFEDPQARGGKPVLWVCLPEHKTQWSK